MKRKLSLLVAVLAAVLLFTVCISAAETFVNPVANGADPFVFKDTDGTYYLYVTSGGSYGYRVYASTNLVEWEARGYCLRRGDVYTDQTEDGGVKGVYNFWAPEIIKEGDTYYMIYTAQEHLGIATSDSPLGPFTNQADSFLADSKAIDGHFFKDDDGQLYLYFVSVGAWSMNGDSVTGGNNIWGGPFDLETQTFAEGYPKLFILNDKKEGLFGVRDTVAEGPEILKHNGKYYLTYSASGYTDPAYAVHYAVSDSPVGPFVKYEGNPVFQSENYQRNLEGDFLYGTAHHCFTTSPDDSELIIVYHAHRSDTPVITEGAITKNVLDIFDQYLTCEHSWSLSSSRDEKKTYKCSKCSATREDKWEYVEERRICIDLAWFDENGVLHAGREKDGHPTASAQVLPSGGKLTRTTHYDGVFADIPNLPTVYVSDKDGSDTNNGQTEKTAFQSLEAAYAALPSGGTIILTQTYQCPTAEIYTLPKTNGPILIKGITSAIPFAYKTLQISSDTYFDDLVFLPQTTSNIAVIDCGWNNVTIGEGVSCQARPVNNEFPYLVGGKWWYPATSAYYVKAQYADLAAVTTDKAYAINVYGGTWSLVTAESVKKSAVQNGTAPNASLYVAGDVYNQPAKASAPTVEIAGAGAKLTFKAVEHAKKYAIYKNGDLVGYSDTTTFVDPTYAAGETATYTVAGYVHGACIGDVSGGTAFTWIADKNGDGVFSLADALKMIRDMLSGESSETLLDLLILLKQLAN